MGLAWWAWAFRWRTKWAAGGWVGTGARRVAAWVGEQAEEVAWCGGVGCAVRRGAVSCLGGRRLRPTGRPLS